MLGQQYILNPHACMLGSADMRCLRRVTTDPSRFRWKLEPPLCYAHFHDPPFPLAPPRWVAFDNVKLTLGMLVQALSSVSIVADRPSSGRVSMDPS